MATPDAGASRAVPKHFCRGYADIVTVEASTGKTKKQLLQPMGVEFPDGKVTAIMGPSGSGKSTLLSVLTDSIQSNVRATANVHLVGAQAFVPQDDRLHGFFTTTSYMHHYARLSGLAGKISKEELNTKIETLLAQLGLTQQASTIVGDVFFSGLSGGQKRRLSVGLETLTDPVNLFLDEPTSGLDAESALQVMGFLKQYSRSAAGRRVILTIHQPSSAIWQLIDNVVLLSKGQLMYQGPRRDMEDFFATSGNSPTPVGWNPADHYVTLVNDEFRHGKLHLLRLGIDSAESDDKEEGAVDDKEESPSVDDWAKLFREYKTGKDLQSEEIKVGDAAAVDDDDVEPESILIKRQSSLGAVGELTYRYFLNLWFNPGILGTRVAMYCMLALMVGALFYGLGDRDDFESINSRTAVLFYCVAFFIFMAVAVLPFTVIERDIVDKEVQNKYYHPAAYQMAQGIASIPSAALLAILTTVIIVPLLSFNDFGWYFLNMFLALAIAEALAQLVSHVVPHFVIGMALLAGLFGFFMLMQGFMLVPSDFPDWLRWTNSIAFHTYSWRSFMVTEFRGETFPDTPFPTGEDVLKLYEIEDVDRGEDMIILACYGLALHLLSFIVLHLRNTLFRGTVEKPKTTAPPADAMAC